MTKTELLFEEYSLRAKAHICTHYTTYSIMVHSGGGDSLHSSDTKELWKMFLKVRIHSKPTLAEMKQV